MNILHRLLVAAALACSGAAAMAAAVVGQPAPDVSGTDVAGRTIHLSDYRGKVVVLEWTNADCPFVQKHYVQDAMQQLQAEAIGRGVVWLTINSSAPGKPGSRSADAARKDLLDAGAAPTAYLTDSDGSIGRTYGARTTPHMFVIDRTGTLAYAGAIDDMATSDPADVAKSHNLVRAALGDLAAGRPVATPSKAPYGCSVKY
jgi:peroxiredoxin